MGWSTLALWLGCQGSATEPPPPVQDSGQEEVPCTDTFPVDTVPEMPTDYETPLPIREDALPTQLSETGLYTEDGEIHPAILAFSPRWPLWSDGLDKQRWAYIPECSTIDTSDPKEWQFPVGTRFWKEFSLDGVKLETRVMERLGPGPQDWAYATYAWDAQGQSATKVGPEGLAQVQGTDHDIPTKAQCQACHGPAAKGGGLPSRGLGFSAVQLDHSESPTTLVGLAERLSTPLESAPLEGDAQTVQALGVLHANCGSCHNPSVDGLPQSDLDLSLAWGAPIAQAGAYTSAVDQPTQLFNTPTVQHRILSGDPEHSAVIRRMESRGNSAQMPPIGTHVVDEAGAAQVRAWIEAL